MFPAPMPTGSGSFEFRRASVADQAAGALREAISQGTWGALLPGEHELARRLNISRPSVRAALSRLSDEGIITISKGCRTRVNAPTTHASSAPPTVCLVAPSSRESFGLNGHPVLMEMRAQFAVLGIGWEEIFDGTLAGRYPERRLARMVNGRRHVCWLLLGATPTIQRWFQQSGVLTLVLGSCHAGIELPSVDVDYFAIGWHASGCLAKAGHHRIAAVIPANALAGDLVCVRGLTEYILKRDKQIDVLQIVAGPSRTSFLSKLDTLLATQPRPTAIFCIHVEQVLMVLVHLLRLGWKIPQQISLLCRETMTAFDLGLPELTRYQSPVAKQAHRGVRVAQSMLTGHPVAMKPHLIMPAFVPGGTLARANPA